MRNADGRTDTGFGVLLAIGTALGLAGGIAAGEPSLGVVVGLGAGGLLALALRISSGRPR